VYFDFRSKSGRRKLVRRCSVSDGKSTERIKEKKQIILNTLTLDIKRN